MYTRRQQLERPQSGSYDFWKEWENISDIELSAIKSTVLARDLVIKKVPPEALVAIYVKGSFTRREMNDRSDVDMVPIVTETGFEAKAFSANIPEVQPVFVVPLSLDEFRKNKLETPYEGPIDLRARPDALLRMIDSCKLIYGSPLNPHDYPIRTPEQTYRDEIEVISKGYIPAYIKGKVDFSSLLKEFFWMTEMELLHKGVKVSHTFEGIAKACDKGHLIQNALSLRIKGTLHKSEEIDFVNKLQVWLAASSSTDF